MPRIRPHSQHMCTYLSAVVLCDQADPDALVGSTRTLSYRSMDGWSFV